MYGIKFTKRAIKKLHKIDRLYQERIIDRLKKMALDPYADPQVKALVSEENYYRLRVADYRIIYQIQNSELIILVIDMNHRKDIY